jgi:hypothetical protein
MIDFQICPVCGVTHGWVLVDEDTGQIVAKLDKCKTCYEKEKTLLLEWTH